MFRKLYQARIAVAPLPDGGARLTITEPTGAGFTVDLPAARVEALRLTLNEFGPFISSAPTEESA
jgi:hypothetical protein